MASPKRILITGAGSGIGLETALELSRRKQSVIAGIRNPKKFQAHWKEIGMEGAPPFEIASFDVTRPDQIKKEVARLLKKGPIHCLINNAGYGLYGCFEELNSNDFAHQFDTNVYGIMNVSRALLPHMRERGSGSIINISSILGRIVLPTGSAYCSSKWAVSGFSRSLRYELAPLGLQVCTVEPGLIRTSFKANMQVPSLEKTTGPYSAFNRMIGSEIKQYGRLSTSAARAGKRLADLTMKSSLPASYRIGLDAKLTYALSRTLPESWLDFLFRMGTKRMVNKWQTT